MLPLIQQFLSPFHKADHCRRFEDWLRRSHEHLWRYARLFSASEQEAEAILSNALAGVMKAFYADRVAEQDLLPYMLRAIKNEAVKQSRQQARSRALEQPCAEESATCEHHSLGAVLEDERALIEAAMQRLPAELSLILRLVFWDGRSFADIARLHAIPKSTVRYRYERALELLKALLRSTYE